MALLQTAVASEFQSDLESVGRIAAVPTILEVVCRTTGMGFAAVARVTDARWVACSVMDEIGFGLKAGGELPVETTICDQIRQSREAVVIDHVAKDPAYCEHATPALYGFQSYISMPIVLGDGSLFGTLCAIDPRPARLNTPAVIGMFRLFAELIAKHLDAGRKLADTESALRAQRAEAELREQFMAVLGHDLRTPMRAISCFTELLLRDPQAEDAPAMGKLILESAARMQALIDNLMDLARGRLAGGLPLHREAGVHVAPLLREVIAEHLVSCPDRRVETSICLSEPIDCDRTRVAQLFSNLLGNALTYGSPGDPVRVRAACEGEGFALSVSNAGEPIPAAALEHLFHPFYRSKAHLHLEGLGLGLYIAHEIAIAHGGTLAVESTAEQTRFTFRMPLR